MTQRDKMRDLYTNCTTDETCVQRYALAEERGEVERRRNRLGLSAENYGRALLADGLRKGWLRPHAR